MARYRRLSFVSKVLCLQIVSFISGHFSIRIYTTLKWPFLVAIYMGVCSFKGNDLFPISIIYLSIRYPTITSLPLSAAKYSKFAPPFDGSVTYISAPNSFNILSTNKWLCCTASINGVSPFDFLESMEILHLKSRYFTSSKWPFLQATCRTVFPLREALKIPPCSLINFKISILP